MGNKSVKEEKTWYKVQKKKTKFTYSKWSKYEAALIGNNEAGKTTFIKRLTNNIFDTEYEETIITQIGVKLIDFKDRLDFPLYLRMYDTPGNAVSHLKDEQTVFETLDFVFVILDGSKVLHKEHIVSINNYVIQRLMTYNRKWIDKANKNPEYKEYLHKLMDEEPDDSGPLLSPDDMYGSVQDDLMARDRNRLDVDGRDDPENSLIAHNNGMSQHTIVNLRQDTYKSNHEDGKDGDDIGNLYQKKKIKPAKFPAVFHIITKKDLLSDEGYEDQIGRARALKAEGIIDEFFLISCKDFTDENGIQDLLEGINDRRLEVMKQEQDERDLINSQKSK